jgi:Na+/phosphate symporter
MSVATDVNFVVLHVFVGVIFLSCERLSHLFDQFRSLKAGVSVITKG